MKLSFFRVFMAIFLTVGASYFFLARAEQKEIEIHTIRLNKEGAYIGEISDFYYLFSQKIQKESANMTKEDLFNESEFDLFSKKRLAKRKRMRFSQGSGFGNSWVMFDKAPEYFTDSLKDAGREYLNQFPIYEKGKEYLSKFSFDYRLFFDFKDSTEQKEPVLQTDVKLKLKDENKFIQSTSFGIKFKPENLLSIDGWQGGVYAGIETKYFNLALETVNYIDSSSVNLEFESKKFFSDKVFILAEVENNIIAATSKRGIFSSASVVYLVRAFHFELNYRHDGNIRGSQMLFLIKKTF